jgi:hypothetical protein
MMRGPMHVSADVGKMAWLFPSPGVHAWGAVDMRRDSSPFRGFRRENGSGCNGSPWKGLTIRVAASRSQA